MARIRRYIRDFPTLARRAPAAVGPLVLIGLLAAAALWASEPSAAHPPETSWQPGRTVATWDWEQHWNYWRKMKCLPDHRRDGYRRDHMREVAGRR